MGASENTSPFGLFSFPHLFVPRAPSPGADERYSVSVVFNAEAQATEAYKHMRKVALETARTKWGAKADDMIKNGQVRMPFRKGEEKEKYDGYNAGDIFINAWTKQAPGVIDGRLNDLGAEDVYAGCVGRITYNCFAYDTQGNKGVSFGLNNCQITDLTTPRLDGRVAANNDFDATDMAVADMSGGGSDDDDDDLPF